VSFLHLDCPLYLSQFPAITYHNFCHNIYKLVVIFFVSLQYLKDLEIDMAWFKREIKGIITTTEEKKKPPMASGINAPTVKNLYTTLNRLKTNTFATIVASIYALAQKNIFLFCLMITSLPNCLPPLHSGDPLHFTDTKKYTDRLKETKENRFNRCYTRCSW
jgi:hypothetical protein